MDTLRRDAEGTNQPIPNALRIVISPKGAKNPPMCINSGQEHSAINKICPYYQFKREVIATVMKKNVTFQEPEDKVKHTFRGNQKQGSSIVKRRPQKENNENKQHT